LQQEGAWDQLTAKQQKRFRNLTDDQARQMMVMDDLWDMADKKAVEVFGLLSLVQMIKSFNGALVEREREKMGKLSKAGRLLAEFFLELRAQGLSQDDVDAGLKTLSPLVVAALTAAYKRPRE
jgi:hypothetical protein